MTEKTKEFLNTLKEKGFWNNDYDYSEVDFTFQNSKVIVIDKKFNTKHLLLPKSLLKSNIKCTIGNCVDKTGYAIKEFKVVHGNKYDYSKYKYSKSTSSSIIICPEHGEFNQSHSTHKTGVGCPKCGRLKTISASKYSHEFILNKIKAVHGNKYDYSKVLPGSNMSVPVIIIDKKMNTKHLISPSAIINRKRGCNIQNAIDSTEYFIKKSKLIHGDKFDYSKTQYVDGNTLVKIKCKEHGFFNVNATQHYKGFGGCKKCTPLNVKKSRGKLIAEFTNTHGDKYDYSLIKKDFITAKEYVDIICPIHVIFSQRVGNHLNGRGCRTCGSGWNTERIINYINDIANKDILSMDPVELNMLIAQGKLPSEFEELVFKLEGTSENSLKSLKEKLGLEEREYADEELSQLGVTLDEMTSESQEEMADALEAISQPQLEELELESEIELKKRKNLPNISNADILVLDKELINSRW